jgi:hypothetical protein
MFAVFSFGADGRVLETSSVDARRLGWGGSHTPGLEAWPTYRSLPHGEAPRLHGLCAGCASAAGRTTRCR